MNKKNQFWQQMRQLKFMNEEESLLEKVGVSQSLEQQIKRTQQNKKSYLYQRKLHGKKNNSNSTIYSKSSTKLKEIKIIDKIQIRRKSCCCKECGVESDKMKKLIGLPFKTAVQYNADMARLGLNTGLRCITFIGKVRKSKLNDPALSSPHQYQINQQISQDSFSQMNDEIQNIQESQTLFNDNMRPNFLTIDYQGTPNIRKKSFTSIDKININIRRSSVQVKPREEKLQLDFKQRRSILDPIMDRKNQYYKNEEDSRRNSVLSRSPANYHNYQYSKQDSYDSEYSDLSESQLKEYIDQQDKKQQKINIMQNQFIQKKPYKPLDKSKNVQKIMNMVRQQNRDGQLQKFILKKEHVYPEIQSPQTPFSPQIQVAISTPSPSSNQYSSQKNAYYYTEPINYQNKNSHGQKETNQFLLSQNDSYTHQNISINSLNIPAYNLSDSIKNQNQDQNYRNQQENIYYKYGDDNKSENFNNDIRIKSISDSNIILDNQYKQLKKGVKKSAKLNLSIKTDENELQNNEYDSKNQDFLTSENKQQHNKIQDEYFACNSKRKNNQLQQMIYLPLSSLYKGLIKSESSSLSQGRKKSIKLKSIVQKNSHINSLDERQQLQQNEQFQTKLNQTFDAAKEGMLISFNKRINKKEEDQLAQLSIRGEIKVQKQQQKLQIQQKTFTPKTTQEKDYKSRFFTSKGFSTSQSSNKKTQGSSSKTLHDSSISSSQCQRDKSPLQFWQRMKTETKSPTYSNKDDEYQSPSNKKYCLTDRGTNSGSYFQQVYNIQVNSQPQTKLSNKNLKQNQNKFII